MDRTARIAAAINRLKEAVAECAANDAIAAFAQLPVEERAAILIAHRRNPFPPDVLGTMVREAEIDLVSIIDETGQ